MSSGICTHDEVKWGRKKEIIGGKEITVCGRCREEISNPLRDGPQRLSKHPNGGFYWGCGDPEHEKHGSYSEAWECIQHQGAVIRNAQAPQRSSDPISDHADLLDAVQLLKRWVHKHPDTDLGFKTLDWLKRRQLQGSPLR